MKITFSDSFWKSLKRLSMHQTWWYKTYEVFRYKIPMFFENLWYFRKELWYFRSWDYTFNLSIFARSLEKSAHTLEFHGNEVEITRMKKVSKMKRVIEIIKNLDESNYITLAENELGELKNVWGWIDDREDTPEEEEHNRRIYDRSTELEKQEFEELWQILKGQNKDEFIEIYKNLSDDEKSNHSHWEKWFDGSGIKNWWD
jgi:hypothetical protein